MVTIRETRLDVPTMTLMKRVAFDGMLAEVAVLCRVPDIAAAHDPDIDAAITTFDWAGAQGVFVIDRATLAITPQPSQPSINHHWDWDTLQWIDDRSLADLKDARWAVLKKQRDDAEFAGFTWDGSAFDSDPLSQSRIQGEVLAATIAQLNSWPFSIEWTLTDNSTRVLDGASMLAVGLAMGQHIDATHNIGRGLRAQLTAATSAAEVDAVQWPV